MKICKLNCINIGTPLYIICKFWVKFGEVSEWPKKDYFDIEGNGIFPCDKLLFYLFCTSYIFSKVT